MAKATIQVGTGEEERERAARIVEAAADHAQDVDMYPAEAEWLRTIAKSIREDT